MNRILLAEDEEHIAKLVEFKLRKEGLDVQLAKNGKEAIDQWTARPGWSLVILDVMMPIMDGWQVLKQIRQDDQRTPVLMLTAKNSEKDVARSAELGATRFLRKPFDPAELARAVREALKAEA